MSDTAQVNEENLSPEVLGYLEDPEKFLTFLSELYNMESDEQRKERLFAFSRDDAIMVGAMIGTVISSPIVSVIATLQYKICPAFAPTLMVMMTEHPLVKDEFEAWQRKQWSE